jgi:arylsulfatase A-like enzyme
MSPDPGRSDAFPLALASVLRWAIWFGALAGLAQAAIIAGVRATTDRLILASWDVVWMAPATNVALFVLAGLVVYATARSLRTSTTTRVILALFVFLFVIGPLLLVSRLHVFAALMLAAGIAIQGARALYARIASFESLVRRTLIGAVCSTAALGAGLHLSRAIGAARPSTGPAAGAPNVLLVVLDTVRAGNLSVYGYGRPTSPQLTRLAETGVLFERAVSTSPWTLPSHATLFTGRLPHEVSADWLRPLDRTHPTIAEVFARRGYVTAAFIGNLLYGTAETGLSRGFARYEDYPYSLGSFIFHSWLARAFTNPIRTLAGKSDRLMVKTASRVNDHFFEWLASHDQTTPFFAFLNYFDAHNPYAPPPPFDTKFSSGGPLPDIMVRRSWSATEIQRSMDAYDGAVAYVDDQLGRLLDGLRSRQLLDNTLVVVTSDHGEQFGEHGLFDHGNSLYWPVLHVPLVVSFPKRIPGGMRVSAAVTLADLPATMLDVAGGSSDRELPGESLQERWRFPSRDRSSRAILAEVSKTINMPEWLPASKGAMKSVVLEGAHYIQHADGGEELYDLDRDRAELDNLAARPEFRSVLQRSRSALAALIAHRDRRAAPHDLEHQQTAGLPRLSRVWRTASALWVPQP